MNATMNSQIGQTTSAPNMLNNRFQLMTFIGMQVLAVHAIGVAADLELADKIGNQTLSVSELSQLARTDQGSLRRLLRALASIGIFHEERDDGYTNTTLSSLIRRDVPDSLWGWAMFFASPLMARPAEALSTSIATGQPVFSAAFGKNFYDFLAEDKRAEAIFAGGMASYSLSCLPEILVAYDFSANRIVDIGGGHGNFLRGILSKNHDVEGILFDLPETIARVDPMRFSEFGTRFSMQAGDFFLEVPAGCDLYILMHVIQNWSDSECDSILKNCRKAMNAGGRILIIETIVREPNEWDFAKFLDLIMLTVLNGRARTLEEHQMLLTRAGFQLSQVIRTQGLQTLIEAVVAA